MNFQELSKRHDRSSFQCGVWELDNYFHHYVTQDVRNRLANCWVMLPEEGLTVIGFYTLNPASIARDSLPIQFQRGCYSDIPVTRLGRFAIASAYRNQGYGLQMLSDAIHRASTQTLKSVGILVDMKTPSLISFYGKLGFVKLPNQNQCFLPFPKLRSLPN